MWSHWSAESGRGGVPGRDHRGNMKRLVAVLCAALCLGAVAAHAAAPGARWLPAPADAAFSVHEVSCASGQWCAGVGTAVVDGQNVSSLGIWNGRAWHGRTAAQPMFADVSCVSTRACVAIGRTTSGYSQLVTVVWDGSRWTSHRSGRRLTIG